MRVLIVLLTLLAISCGFTGTVKTDEAALVQVVADFQPFIDQLERGKEDDEAKLLVSRIQEYKYDVVTVTDGFQIRVRDIRRFVTLGSASECATWFQYSSSGKYPESNVLKKVEGWALIRECHA